MNKKSFSLPDERFSFASTILVALLLMVISLHENLPSISTRIPIIHLLYLGMVFAVMASMLVPSLAERFCADKGRISQKPLYVFAGAVFFVFGGFLLSCFIRLAV